jgi:hypothetical protein
MLSLGTAGGDPHFITLDNMQYSFNGYGQFIFLKASDDSFEIQVQTNILDNTNSQSNKKLAGTIFTRFAMRTNQTPIFQIEIGDEANSPYLGISFNYLKSNLQII